MFNGTQKLFLRGFWRDFLLGGKWTPCGLWVWRMQNSARRVYVDAVYLGRVLGTCYLLLGLEQGPDTSRAGGLEWAGKGATVPSMDNVCLSWALLKVLLSSSAVPALSNCGVKHGSICRGTSLKKSCREGAVQVFRHEFEFCISLFQK